MFHLVIIATVTVGVETKIDKSLIDSSGLTGASLLGWQLLYILPVAVLTNDFFLSNFWIRTFASRSDRDLWIGVSIAAVVTLIILTLVGSTGLIATVRILYFFFFFFFFRKLSGLSNTSSSCTALKLTWIHFSGPGLLIPPTLIRMVALLSSTCWSNFPLGRSESFLSWSCP